MSLESIQSYCQKENFAGNTHIQCVPIQWVDNFPDFAKDGHNFSNQITLKPGKVWLLFPCAADTIDFKEDERSGAHGSVITPTITGFVPNDTPQIASVLNSAKANQWIVILYYKTGEAKVIGSLDIPARFSSSFNNRGSLNSGKGYDIEFYSQSSAKSFFVDEIPDPNIVGCFPGTANVNQSDGTLISAVTVASNGTENYNVADSTITINTNEVTTNVKATASKNYNLLDSNGNPITVDSVSGDDVTLPVVQEVIYDIYVNGVFDQNVTLNPAVNNTINITA